MEILIIILLLITIGLESYRILHKSVTEEKKSAPMDNEKKKKQEDLRIAFDNLMNYSIEKAIESKRGDN